MHGVTDWVTDLVDVLFDVGVLLVHVSLFICIVCIPMYKVSRLMLTRWSFVWFPSRTQLLRSFIDWRWWILRVLPFVWCVSGAYYYFYGNHQVRAVVENLFSDCWDKYTGLSGEIDTSPLPRPRLCAIILVPLVMNTIRQRYPREYRG